jgi:hypothetical protein
LLAGIYIFYENWSTETSRKEWLKGIICYALTFPRICGHA